MQDCYIPVNTMCRWAQTAPGDSLTRISLQATINALFVNTSPSSSLVFEVPSVSTYVLSKFIPATSNNMLVPGMCRIRQPAAVTVPTPSSLTAAARTLPHAATMS